MQNNDNRISYAINDDGVGFQRSGISSNLSHNKLIDDFIAEMKVLSKPVKTLSELAMGAGYTVTGLILLVGVLTFFKVIQE